MSDFEALARWYVVLTFFAIATLPLLEFFLRELGGYRYGLLRPFASVVIAAVVWWPASLLGLPFTRTVVLAVTVMLSTAAWAYFGRTIFRQISWRSLALFEGGWLAVFLGYALFRSYNPDILHTEKPMEIAFLASSIRSSSVPAPDPWFAGEAINYYTFGYHMIATIAKAAGIPASIAFNLALATLIASCCVAVAAIGGFIVRLTTKVRIAGAIAAVATPLICIFGANLWTTTQLIRAPRETIDASWWEGVGWNASRIIVDHGVNNRGDSKPTINEFPAFSFVLGDLHPHVLSYPLLALVVAFAVMIAMGRVMPPVRYALLPGALAGLLYASNSWDAPTAIVVLCGAALLAARQYSRQVLKFWGAAAAAAIVAALPFLLKFKAPLGVDTDLLGPLKHIPVLNRIVATFGIVIWKPSDLRELALVYGAWLAIFVLFAYPLLRDDRQLLDLLSRRRHLVLAIGLLAVGIALVWAPAVIVLGLPIALSIWITRTNPHQPSRVIAAIFAAGFGLALIPEFIFLQDPFGDRMNTMFKFGFQAWLLLSIASVVAVVTLLRRVLSLERALGALGALVLIATLTYAPLSADDWTNGFAERRGLDGRAYMALAAPDDLAAIEWLETNARSGAVIAEVPSCSYQMLHGVPGGRIAAYTGMSGWIGWYFHEYQWRRGQFSDITQRLNERVSQAQRALQANVSASELDIDFLIVGEQERQPDPGCQASQPLGANIEGSLESQGWQVVFQQGQMTIFGNPSR